MFSGVFSIWFVFVCSFVFLFLFGVLLILLGVFLLILRRTLRALVCVYIYTVYMRVLRDNNKKRANTKQVPYLHGSEMHTMISFWKMAT